jgi:hypothetical protein
MASKNMRFKTGNGQHGNKSTISANLRGRIP